MTLPFKTDGESVLAKVKGNVSHFRPDESETDATERVKWKRD